ncbi:3-deoxy-manno-octulosonate cytidylyltransferase [Phaeovibrio sulfidiphilus]|uniref:3-deoxy-manno-octulosonate cytidylyltransferase n=1 Tax=Phaeovibrio sulfidiphilus TaxID=1220600 RepID=A0A8J6YMC0_9PROT|nr:3-deoxy-manno-octulosonate cytidylyltransferase [Phaeovibrio sulfidiphilus]MBE1237318.1 3-deoxy-manno-octulosonate cytidylyltransferase [Phaeovibrio sulfidiphilus]
MSSPSPVVIIPARLKATRLPNKPLALIAGEPMIVQVWRRAMEANVGPVFVAAGDQEIVTAIEKAGGNAVLTDPDLPSGSDRVWQALGKIDPGHSRFDVVMNVQGDVPTLDPAILSRTYQGLLDAPHMDISTPVCAITDPSEETNPNVVKAAVGFRPGETSAPALYFSRTPVPSGEGPHYHHIGVYVWKREALESFVRWPTSVLERRENLEQLRAMEHGLRIQAVLVNTAPLGVDTADDLARARQMMES